MVDVMRLFFARGLARSLVIFFVLGIAATHVSAQHRNGSFRTRIAKQTTLQYLLYLPESYSTKNKWPLIVYLHGGSTRGDDVNKIRESGLARRLEMERDFPFPWSQRPTGAASRILGAHRSLKAAAIPD
jgi:poly(3-hydroxybutyrate) depolymerase